MLELALCADLVIASDDARIGTPYSRVWGCQRNSRAESLRWVNERSTRLDTLPKHPVPRETN